MIWYLVFVTAILIQETGELELTSTITLVLQANRLTNWQEHSSINTLKKHPENLELPTWISILPIRFASYQSQIAFDLYCFTARNEES